MTRGRDIEEAIADAFERAHFSCLGVAVGRRERHDGQQGLLLVDFIYPDSPPTPVALEVTQLAFDVEMAAGSERRKLGDELSAIARSENLGFWAVHLGNRADFRRARAVLLGLMRAGVSVRVDRWRQPWISDEHLPEAQPFLDLRAELLAVNIYRVEKSTRPVQDGVGIDTSGPIVIVTGFGARIEEMTQVNANKLEAARPRSTHLAVLVNDRRCSEDPSLSLPPVLPDSIDFLWVVHDLGQPGGLPHGWWIRRGDTDWREITPGDFSRMQAVAPRRVDRPRQYGRPGLRGRFTK